MKKVFSWPIIIGLSILLLNSCVKDNCTNSYSFYVPEYKTSAQVRNNIKSTSATMLHKPGKLFIKGNYLFINDIDRGIHIYDNSNPSSPKPIAFINIPGNMDMAVKGNMLYADLYMDLVAIDITNPLNVQAKYFVDDVFPFRRYINGIVQDSSKIITNWIKKDTIINIPCKENIDRNNPILFQGGILMLRSSSFVAASPFGIGGSMARYSIVENSLFTVTDSKLNVFEIKTEKPQLINKVDIGFGIETVYPFKNKLFIGSNTGMFIYDVSQPGQPVKLGQFNHVLSCDPVIADDDNAFVTLRSGTNCRRGVNQLDVLDIKNLTQPALLKSYDMNNPHGLSKDGNILFVCDGKNGLIVYDATNPTDLKQITHIKNLDTYDVIALNNIAIVVAKDGVYQFDYSNIHAIKQISKISIQE